MKSYDQGRIRWQGETLDGAWLDEEPPADIFSEAVTRTNATNGIVYLTFTPLLGMSQVVLRFLREKPKGYHTTIMTIADAGHYTKEEAERIIAAYPAHEREARAYGVPMMGEGRVFEFEEKTLQETAIMIPEFWPRLCAIDLGYDHYTAVVWLAWDRDVDTIHLYDCYKVKQALMEVHAAAITRRGPWPVVWPHDALQHDPKSGATIAKQYADMGLNMHHSHATHTPEVGKIEGTGGFGFEAGISELANRMSSGRLKVAQHLNLWFEEFRQFHREGGKVVKVDDDLMSATRVGVMMIRHAKTLQQLRPQTRRSVTTFQVSDRSMGVLG